MHKKIIILFLALAWTIVITVFSLITIGKIVDEVEVPFKDKIVHFLFYFVFVVLWYSYVKFKNIFKHSGLIVLVTAIVFGIVIEICQSTLTVARKGDPIDVLANSIGAISGLIFIVNWNKFVTKKKINLA